MAAGDGTRLLFKIPAADTSKVGASIDAIRAVATDADSSTDLRFMVSQNDETLDTAMTINSAGQVGIGTDSPGRLLELSNATNPAVRINNGNSTADIGIASSAGALLTSAADDDLVIARNGAYGIAIGTNGQTRMSISSAGQVEVASGNAHISSSTQSSLGFGNISTNTYAKVEYDDTNGNFNINNTRAYPLRFLTNDTERMTISSAGAVSILGTLSVTSGTTIGSLDIGHGLGAEPTNTAIGKDALDASHAGATHNTAVGSNALGALNHATTAVENTAVGSGAGDAILSGARNTAVGQGSLSAACERRNKNRREYTFITYY
jgi:hypothetical protein